MADELVTAVITTYKRDVATVERALRSVVQQEYSNLEIIVVNDDPEDENLVHALQEMISGYQKARRITYIIVPRNGGACKARNIALRQAQGKYIAFLDDDDEWLPNKIALQADCLEKHPDACMVYCNSYLNFEESKTRTVMHRGKQPEGRIFYALIEENIIGSCTYPMFRVHDLKATGGFGEYMPALQDWELYLRLLKEGKACYLSEPLAEYYFYSGERLSAHPERRVAAFERIEQEFQKAINTKGKEQHKSFFYLKGTYFYVMNDQVKQAIASYVKAVCSDPSKVKRNLIELLKLVKRIFIKPTVY